ncbi:MAG: COX15/CtaA family protein [Methylobacteriaceae bacterium]|nr:COX15/CtaA family protein [Methylobacteriaceae bacterium]MBV9703214.1 COX15/CtaA family protein [Methylobacteriaceae bacterium]
MSPRGCHHASRNPGVALTDRLTDATTTRAAPDALAPVRAWLWCVAGLVFLMVVAGGATRLTEAGLSITEWKLVSGVLPPLDTAQWQAEFEKYKQIPQYSQLFPTMSLTDFQFIYSVEWFHRLLGRLIGVAFILPLAWFWTSGRLPANLKPKLVALLGLGALQGAVGWWMVTSGLSDRVEVSQYRLAVHLLLASLTYAALIWLAVGLAERRPQAAATLGRLRAEAGLIVALVLLQIGLGALVAGLRAGWTFNTWPLMDGRLVPPLHFLFNERPWWANFFENVTLVQFQHRMIAYLVLAAAAAHAFDAARVAPGHLARRALALAALVAMQALIGITTLVLAVPLWAGLLHQAFAMVVLAAAVINCRRLCERLQESRLGGSSRAAPVSRT